MLLGFPESLGMHHDLMPGINGGNTVVALNDPVGTFHLRALVVAEIALPGLPTLARLVIIAVKPTLNFLNLLPQRLEVLFFRSTPETSSSLLSRSRCRLSRYRIAPSIFFFSSQNPPASRSIP